MEVINWIYDHFDTFAGIFAVTAHIFVLVVWMFHSLSKKIKNGNHPKLGDCNKNEKEFTHESKRY